MVEHYNVFKDRIIDDEEFAFLREKYKGKVLSVVEEYSDEIGMDFEYSLNDIIEELSRGRLGN